MSKMKDMAINAQQIAEIEEVEYMEHQHGLVRFGEMSITKDTINQEVSDMVEKVKDGMIDPIKAIAFLNAIDNTIKAVRGQIMEYGVDEFQKYAEKEITVMDGCHVSIMEAGTRYDFSNTEKWNAIKARENEVAEERKQLETTLKTLTKPMEVADDETGELITLNPAIKTSSTILKVTIK